MSTVTSCPGEVELRKLVEATLSVPEQTSVTAHVESCPACQAALERVSGGWAERISEKLSQREGSADQTLQDAVNRLIDRLRNDRVSAATILEGVSIADTKLDFLQPSDKPGVLGTLGSYEITEMIGRGGMGVVLKGFDPRLNRFVAVKVLAPETASNATARRRFLREAQAAAAISHDHVVTIHAVDESERLPYLVMEYVSGMSLQDLINQKGALELKQILRIGMQTASGLAAAHAQGLVHRDIKPANILLENGVQRVKITDFGLARAVDDVGMTQTGVVTGTPLFMSPEQARGEPIDHRTDLFSLGSVLYAMCTGRAPFRAETTMGVLRRVCEDTPRPIQEVNAEIPDWLCAVVERLLEKNPDDRFQSAAEVAEQLGGWLAYLQQPASAARPVTIAPRKRPWTLRKAARMVGSGVGEMVLGIVTLCAMVAVITLVRGYFFGEERGVGFALTSQNGSLIIDVNDPTITQIQLSARDEPASKHLKRVSSLEFQLNGQRRLELPDYLGPGLYQISFRREGPALFEDQAVRIHSNETKHVSVPVGGSRFDAAEETAERQPSSDEPRLQATLRNDARTAKVTSLAISPDGWWVAAGREDGTLDVLDLAKEKEGSLWSRHLAASVRSVAFSHDGHWLAAAESDGKSGTVHLWNISTHNGRPIQVHFAGGPETAEWPVDVPVHSVAFSPDGRQLVAGLGDENSGEILVWDTAEQKQVARHKEFDSAVRSLTIMPDNATVMAAMADGGSKVIDMNSGKVEMEMNFSIDLPGVPKGTLPQVAQSFAFLTPERGLTAFGDPHGSVRIADLEMGEQRSFRAHDTAVAAVALSPDGRLLATAGQGSEVKIWNLAHLQSAPGVAETNATESEPVQQVTTPTRTIRGHQEPLNAVAVSPDGRLALTGSSDRTLRQWNVETGRELRRMSGHTDFINAVALSLDGQRALSGSKDGTVRLWDTETGDEIRSLRGHRGWIYAVAISPDGRRAVSGSAHWGVESPDNTMRLWDLETGDQVRSFEGHTDGVLGVAFSPDGRLAASASFDGSVRLWNIETGELVRLLEHPSRAYSVAFTPDGRHVVSGCGSLKPHDDRVDDPEHCVIRVWDVETGKLGNVLRGHSGAVLALSLSADGRYLASGSGGEYFDDGKLRETRDHTIRLWDLTSGREVCRFHSESMVLDVALAPDSRVIVSGHMDHALRVWNVPEQVLAVPPSHSASGGSEKNAAESEPVSDSRLIEMLGDRAGRVIEKAYRPSWSPDGRSILYTHSDESELKIVDLASREARTLVRAADYFTDSGVVDGVWSPDGKRVAFVQRPKTRREDRLQREEICIVDADGTGVRRLASGGYPSWSADSTRIYFQDRHSRMLRLIEAGRENAEPQDVIKCDGYYPVVSPDEKYVAFGVGNELTIAALGTKKVVATWQAPVPLGGLIVGWSPDSHELGIGGYTSEWIGFWIYDLRTREAERVWNAPVSEGAWSADGKRFAFVVRGMQAELWSAALEPGSNTSAALRKLVSSRAEEP